MSNNTVKKKLEVIDGTCETLNAMIEFMKHRYPELQVTVGINENNEIFVTHCYQETVQ